MFGLFSKSKEKRTTQVTPITEAQLDTVANVLASDMITAIQEGFKQSQENSQKEYETAVRLHKQYVANVDAKPYKGSVAPVPLSPYEALFLWYINGYPAKEPGIAIYWTYEHSLGDFSVVIEKLIRAGYLRVSDYRFSMQKCTLPEIKEVLKANGLAVSGKKADLTKRLEDNIPADALEKTFDRGYLQLTESGNILLERYKAVILCHQYKNLMVNTINPDTVYEFSKAHADLNEHEILIEMNKLAVAEWENDETHLPHIVGRYAIARLYDLLGNREEALRWYLLRCYMDISGASENTGAREKDNSTYRSGVLFYKSEDAIREKVQFAPAVIHDTKECINSLALTDDQLQAAYATATKGVCLVGAVYSPLEGYRLLLEALKNI